MEGAKHHYQTLKERRDKVILCFQLFNASTFQRFDAFSFQLLSSGAPTQVFDSCSRLFLGCTQEGVAKDRRAIGLSYELGARRAEARGNLPPPIINLGFLYFGFIIASGIIISSIEIPPCWKLFWYCRWWFSALSG